MGNTEARRKPRASSLILHEEDLHTVERQYNAMCAGQATISKRSFDITITSFVQFAEETLHSSEQQAKWLISFGQPLHTIVDCMVESFFICEEQGCCSSDRALLVDYLLVDGPQEPITYERVHQWLDNSMVFQMIVNRVFDAFLLGRRKKALPFLGEHHLLSASALCLIINYLPIACRYQWTPLYSSNERGLNFAKLSKAISGMGACLVVIESKSGRTFGGFANAGFVTGNMYRGDKSCFLFEDHHALAIYKATGLNENFAYLNCHNDTLPNGLGLGGHGQHWSFFIDAQCKKGLSAPHINTFENCWLAGEHEFEVKTLEVWRIGRDVRVRFDTLGNEIPLEEDDRSQTEQSSDDENTYL
ncbi:unnamed protein product [Toxocara canis]|uniref:MTOR-associated protein MEAK7 n=1 Tax=Toxocara canis TaxID=6265 RepID=A0A183URH7_TOXCA|nr:unnamed protein product [Toxocara canis]